MPTYVLPQTLVFQDFNIVPSVAAHTLSPHIAGGHAHLVQYDEGAQYPEGSLGYYDREVDDIYLFPNRPAGGEVDDTYTKVFIKDALLRYYDDPIGSGSPITKQAGSRNKIRSTTINFQDQRDYGRSSLLYDRDVKPGDAVELQCVPGSGDPFTIWTYIKDVEGDIAAAIVSDADSSLGNAQTQVASLTVNQTKGPSNCVELTTDASGYDGRESGYISETYRLKVTRSSVGGDLTKATLRLISGSGSDDVDEFSPLPDGTPTFIGTRGLTIDFGVVAGDRTACEAAADTDSAVYDDLIRGQEWTITVNQAYTAPEPTGGGTYDDDDDTTYVINVVEGGLWDDQPKIQVTTNNGVDLSGPSVVSGASVDVPVGSRGLTVSFDGDGLRKGDSYYIEVTGRKEAARRTLVLGHNIPDEVADGDEVGVTLYIRKPDLEIPKNREGFAPLVNWEQNDTQITIKQGIIAYDPSWTDEGVPVPIDVVSAPEKEFGRVYVEYRAWRSDLTFNVNSVRDVGELDDAISGPLHPDNPLKWGVFKALSNSNGIPVTYTAVGDPDNVGEWTDVLEILLGRDDVYNLVPLTRNRTVQDLYASHVDAMSSPEQGLWRVTWFALEGIPEIPVVHNGSEVSGYIEGTTDNGEMALAVFEDDPRATGIQYTQVRCTTGNANFLSNNVRPGDIVRALYTGNGFGEFEYREFIVDEVVSEESLRVLVGTEGPVSIPQRIEIWRNLNATDEAEEIARDGGAWSNRRVRAVWPDRLESAGTIQEGYHLAAALAGLSSGVLPHQGLTRLEIAGFSDVPRTWQKFNRPQLDTMAYAGVWIVTQDRRDGEIFTRHAVTTDDYDNINVREEMITRNVDSISYRFKQTLEPFIGVTNVTPSMQAVLEFEIRQTIEVLRTERFRQQLGGQLVNGEITILRPHTTLRDRYVVSIDAHIPYALNNIELHLVV